MDKTIIRNFAIESRKDLIEKIDRKIKLFYVDEEFSKDIKGDVIVLSNSKHTLTLTKEENENRDKLLRRIVELGYEQVVEEAAYTWFNRIIAIRFMELHDYLPLSSDNQSLGIRVLSSIDDSINPDILKFSNLNNSNLDIGFNIEKYSTLNSDDSKFKYVLLLICHKLGKVIPQVFDGVTDYIDLLIPDNMLSENGFIKKLISNIPKSNFEEVEIIGWLYQYYISEKKDYAFSNLKKNIKLNKDSIPAATQLFTPNWIVEYMVENTLGQYSENKTTFNHYVKCNLKEKLEDIQKIKFIDPCSGSGHILVSAFEMFYNLYLEQGYLKSDIPKLILENNIYGIDIDERATQLSILTLYLKARKYDKNFYNKKCNLNIISIVESNYISKELFSDIKDSEDLEVIDYILDVFKDAKEYGSIIEVKKYDYDKLEANLSRINNLYGIMIQQDFFPLIKQAKLLSSQYNIVVTNPPYMASKGMDDKLSNYVKKYYPNSKSDMFSVFVERVFKMCETGGFYGMITQPSILFLSSFMELREMMIKNNTILSLLHMGRGIFGVDFGSTAFVLKKEIIKDYYGYYFRLHERTFQYIDLNDIEELFVKANKEDNFTYDFSKYKLSNTDNIDNIDIEVEEDEEETIESKSIKLKYKFNQENFLNMPNNIFGYWMSENMLKLFIEKNRLGTIAEAKSGIMTGDDPQFIKNWFEVDYSNIDFNGKSFDDSLTYKWFPVTRGGLYRKWYGNLGSVVNLENKGYAIKNNGKNFRLRDEKYYFKKGITWTMITTKDLSVRIVPDGVLFGNGGPTIFLDDKLYYYLALLNSNIINRIIYYMNPTMNIVLEDIQNIPVIEEDQARIESLAKENVDISKSDWDSDETSWDFKKHELIGLGSNISECMNILEKKHLESFNKLKSNEETINRIFIDMYGLSSEMTNTIDDEKVSLKTFNKENVIKSLISYAVGCMFGRYSLDSEGLIFASKSFNKNAYKKYLPDEDNIIPISDNDSVYYNDDIVGKFKDFIKTAFGSETLNTNLNYIAETLGKRGTESNEETIRRYFINDFYGEHLRAYQKKPIYWMFDSGKKNGFKCLIYMHRYDEQIVSKIRTKYLHKTISVYQRNLEEIDYKLNNDELSTIDKRELQNKKSDLNAKITECNEYEEKVGNVANKMIKLDLDDGVMINYSKFIDDNGKSILAKIK